MNANFTRNMEMARLLDRFERRVHRMGELWERCQGKSWPEREADEFATLRDVQLPQTREALLGLLVDPAASAPTKMPTPPAQAEPLDVAYAEGWNAACDAFFGGKPAPEALVITVESKFDVLTITTAYEQGVGKGYQARQRGAEIDNPYADGPCREAWSLGYAEGKSQADRQRVPEGCKVVPVEPTCDMLAAMSGEWHPSRHGKAREQYAAMLAAAPDAPASQSAAEVHGCHGGDDSTLPTQQNDWRPDEAIPGRSNSIYHQAFGADGKAVQWGVRSSQDPNRDMRIMDAAVEFFYAVQRGVAITPEVLWKHVMGSEWVAPEAQEIADVWHEGSQSFYRAVLLKKLTHDDVFFDPAGSPETQADECSATGRGHTFGAHGPNGERQCEHCGEAPAQADRQRVPDGYVLVARPVLKKLGIADAVIDTIALPAAPEAPAQFDWSKLPGYLIERYEGETLTEELLQRATAELAAPEAPAQAGDWASRHDLYTDADKDRPDVICDSNGSVTLGLCKRCGKGEAELDGPCVPELNPVDVRVDVVLTQKGGFAPATGSGVRLTHIPTGITLEETGERSKHKNREVAWHKLAKLVAEQASASSGERELNRLLNDFARACAFGDDRTKRMAASKAIHDLFEQTRTDACVKALDKIAKRIELDIEKRGRLADVVILRTVRSCAAALAQIGGAT